MRLRIRTLVFLFILFLTQTVVAENEATRNIIDNVCTNDSPRDNNHLHHVPESWFTPSRNDSEEYKLRIERIESEEGVYSHNLVPELIGLGLVSLEQSKPAESVKVFERALYVIRTNDGLYSQKQLALLDYIIIASSALEDWKKVAQSYDLMYWLYKRNYKENDPRQLQALKRLRGWYMESYNKSTERSLEELFTKSEEIYERAIRIMWDCTGGNERETMCFWHKSCCPEGSTNQGVCPLDIK